VKICDMGWAVHTMGMRISRCGTPLYQSPEVIKGIAYDERVDIWAVGAITFELLTSMIPFKIWCEEDLKKIVMP
jgi:serine/threonine protein kinase